MQVLYDAEVNYSLSVSDGRYSVRLGDDVNGWTAMDHFDTLDQAVDWLVREAGIDLPPETKD